MKLPLTSCLIAGVIAIALFVLTGLPVSAQKSEPNPPGKNLLDASRGREIASLVSRGQLGLRDATSVAEKHAQGIAMQVTCRVEVVEDSDRVPQSEQPIEPALQPPTPPRAEQPGVKRLVYDVTVFAKDKIETVYVDGLSRKVIERPNW